MNRLIDIVPMMLSKTKSGKVAWEKATGGAFMARVGSATIEMSVRGGETCLALKSQAGDTLETICFNPSHRLVDRQLFDLYEESRRRALGVDAALSSVREALESM
jgi:hypothetical protein